METKEKNIFRLKQPCSNCPFRKDENTRGWLGRERAHEIANGVLKEDWGFHCHKTTGIYGNESKHGKQICAGSIQMLHFASKEESPFGNVFIQLGERTGAYDPNEQKWVADIFQTAEEMADWHDHEQLFNRKGEENGE